MPERPPTAVTVIKLAWCCLLASVVAAALMFPVVGGFGLVSNRASDVVANGSAQLVEGEVPQVSTMVDAKGNVIAWLYSQRRFEVPSDRIANTMKLAIVSIEDKRFAEHNGVDWQGTLTGLSGYLSGNLDTRGGSTLEQQYVKNYQLLVIAQTDAEKRAAIETTPARKLREIRMALTLDKTFTKPEILTRYLNLVSFGNGAFGIQDAAQTYFGINASELNWQQAALLAGLVQSTSSLNPYTNPEGALARRNVVLDTMIENLPEHAEELRTAKEQPLGVLPQPNELPRGCIAAGDRAFFCDYALEYLARAGISKEQVARGGYLIKTTLDPDVQGPVKSAVDSIASPDLDGVASVMSVIKPGKESHPVLAMASNRTYGLNLDAGETMQPQPFSLVGDGAGSTFKIFTVAAALEMGMGINAQLDVPAQFQAKGLGSSESPGCPAATWCVKNAGGYRGSMNITDALATSPNTAFAKLISQVGVQRSVDMAVRLGMRSYALPGTARDYDPESNESLADFVKRQNLGSFTLGPIEVNALEFSNVAATLASGGMWCPPTPIDKVFDRDGEEVAVTTETCEQAVPEGLANTLANAMSKDDRGAGPPPGRPARRAGTCRCRVRPVPPRRTARLRSSGSPTRWPAANYIYDDSTTPGELCSFPLRKCGYGDLFGGNEPARTWFTAMKPIANNFGEVKLPPTDPRYRRRRTGFAGAQRVGPEPGHRTAAAPRGRLPGRRPGHAGQQLGVVRHGGRHVAGGADDSGFDHHDPDLQRHPAATAAAAASGRPAIPGLPAPVGRDGRRDPRPAADHRAGAGSAATAAAPPPPPLPPPPSATTAVIRSDWQ